MSFVWFRYAEMPTIPILEESVLFLYPFSAIWLAYSPFPIFCNQDYVYFPLDRKRKKERARERENWISKREREREKEKER